MNKIALMTHMCQKFAANIGNTEVTYKPPIDAEYEEYASKEEEDMKNRPRHSLRMNIISTSPYPVRNKQLTSYVGGKKKSITVNKESNKEVKDLVL